jgi:quinol monooxygenase YgiN
MSAMPNVTVVATLRAAKGKADALAALLVEQAAVIRKTEPGCVVYRVHRSTSDPDAFLFYEIYADDAAFAAHRASPHLAQYRKQREDDGLLDGPVDVQIYRSITE